MNYISNCFSRHGLRVKAWNQSSRFDRFYLFSPVREKWIVRSRIRRVLLQMFHWPNKSVWRRKNTLWLHDSCLFVVILGSIQELNEHFLGKFNAVPKSSSCSIAIFLNNSVFLNAHFQFSHSVFIRYVFYVLMELHCHCVCFNIVSGNHSWVANYYSIK